MADDDNFDIDIYGDGEGMDEDSKAYIKEENEKRLKNGPSQPEQASKPPAESTTSSKPPSEPISPSTLKQAESKLDSTEDTQSPVQSTSKPSPLPTQQGTKRKGESDDRRIDAGATNALLLSDLHWYTTEDDIRSWANDANAEDEIKDITFSEHKVNGKSKGQAYIEFTSPQASTALKQRIDSGLVSSAGAEVKATTGRKFSVVFANVSNGNPFKTLPKDAPARAKEDHRTQRTGSTPYSGGAPNHQHDGGGYRGNSGFRGGRGGYGGGRGNFQGQNNFNHNNNANNNSGNRNFSGPMSMNGGSPGFGGQVPFQQGMNNFNGRGGGFSPRGGAGGAARGGRGGSQQQQMNMGMPPMGMNMAMMGMNPMVTGMGGPGFGNMQFNPAMFGGNQGMNMNGMNMGMGMGMNGGGVGDWGHGPKRQRQD